MPAFKWSMRYSSLKRSEFHKSTNDHKIEGKSEYLNMIENTSHTNVINEYTPNAPQNRASVASSCQVQKVGTLVNIAIERHAMNDR